MKILYFTFIENPFAPENAGVMRGQVINVLKSISKTADDVELHWLALINTGSYKPTEEEINLLKAELREYNIVLKIIEIPSGKLSRWVFAKDQLAKYASIYNPDIVHCRVYPSTVVALGIRDKFKFSYKVIFDARGVYPEQILERSDGFVGKVRYKWWKLKEKRLLRDSDLIVGVTNAFVDHFKKINDKSSYKFIPCCVDFNADQPDNENKALKNELGFSDNDLIAVYSGNLSAKYSSVNYIADIFTNLYKNNSN
ncbi:MAG: glycosyltransferase, partial [Vampirovibrionia bacterium]